MVRIELDRDIMGKLRKQAKEFKKKGKSKAITIGKFTRWNIRL